MNGRKLDSEEIMIFKNNAWENLKIKTYLNGKDDEMKKLVDQMIDFF